MPLIQWDQKFSVGVQAMDQQHQRWFGILNNLHEAMQQGKGKEVLHKILAEMTDYTRTHFQREEELLKSAGYPQLAEHLGKHKAFTGKIAEMETKANKGDTVLTFDLMDSLKAWLEDHILKEDAKYGIFLAGAGKR